MRKKSPREKSWRRSSGNIWPSLENRLTRTRFSVFSVSFVWFCVAYSKTYPGALQKLILGSLNILLLATPCSQDWSLQRSAVWESEGPWSLGLVVDGVQVDWSLFLWLTTWQEGDSCEKIMKLVRGLKRKLRTYRERRLGQCGAKLWLLLRRFVQQLVWFPCIPYQRCTCLASTMYLPSRRGGRSKPCSTQPRRLQWLSGNDQDRDHHRARSRVQQLGRCPEIGTRKHNAPRRWHSPR